MAEQSLPTSKPEAHCVEPACAAAKPEAMAKRELGRAPASTVAPTLAPDLAQKWLAWQCQMVAGIICGALYRPADVLTIGPAISTWPAGGQADSQLAAAASLALASRGEVLLAKQRYGPEGQRTCDQIAFPLLVDSKPVAVVSVMMSPRSEPQQHAVLQLMQWGGLWVESLIQQQVVRPDATGAFALQALTAILGHPSSQVAASEAVNQLAEHFDCERVSLGLREGLAIRLMALSNVVRFDARSQLVRRIEAAMEEAVDQDCSLVYPTRPAQASVVTRAHAELADQASAETVCTLPLRGRTRVIGALTLERRVNRPFRKETVQELQSLAKLLGHALDLKRQEERSVGARFAELLRELAGGVFGAHYLKLKLATGAALVLIGLLSLVNGTHEVTATAAVEGVLRQLLVAPQSGYVKQAEVRAGDRVKKGQRVAVLDDRTLQLELQKWRSERNKIQTEHGEALAGSERATLSILRAQLGQVDAEIKLVEEKIRRTQLHADFDGIVVSGDLSQSLGAPVEMGQVLYEIATLESYRVVLEVDEFDVAGLSRGKSGRLVISALPSQTLTFVVEQVVPVATSSEAHNFFRVDALLDKPTELLRPGMRGVAKIAIGERSLLWIWTHSVVDRMRLWLWSLGW